VLIGLLIYGLAIIYRNSFLIDSRRYFVLFDDMMVSMRYAKHLANGVGLVWNPGQVVQGFTNPLWVFYMTGIHLLSVPANLTGFFIQITNLVILLMCVRLTGLLTKKLTGSAKWQKLALFLTAAYFPLLNWTVIQGTEVGLLCLLTLLLLLRPSSRLSGWLIAAGIWTRMDFLVIALVLTYFYPRFLKPVILATFSLLLWQKIYFGEWLPNTYFLKMTGYPILLRISRGAIATLKFLKWWSVIPVWALIITKSKRVWLPLFIVMGVLAYNIFVGADAWEQWGGANRYLVVVMPLFISLFVWGAVNTGLFGKWKAVTLATIILSFVSLNSIDRSWILPMMLIKSVPTMADNRFHVLMANYLKTQTSEHDTIGLAWAGTIPYFLERNYVDFLGKNDMFIARQTAKLDCSAGGLFAIIYCYYPGHMKWDYQYSIERKQPDIVLQMYPASAAEPYMKEYITQSTPLGGEIHVRK
jgi:arabinofuranosyltransferase